MSTKIYDAYKLSGKYDIVSLNTAEKLASNARSHGWCYIS